ncbi:MAG: YigZ family protein [Dokdonella sp.]|nr:MAG: YigZ family protein [Gammaproteobacteria bacterium]TXI77749.1 MAG: YigZ family protein [Dokdonella sp.]
MNVLHTLRSSAQLQQEIRKSRFLAQADRVDSPDEAMTSLKRLSDPLATHNCWAWRIGALYRFSDDGEPGGTAGRPILQAIEGQGMDRVLVVVTRWYGGIKLGTGGLARAYGGCAAECLRLAERIPLVAMTQLRAHCEFALLPLLTARLPEFQAEKLEETFDARGAWLSLRLPRDQAGGLRHLLTNLSKGRAIIEPEWKD